MRDLGAQPAGLFVAICGLLGFLALADAGVAGTGRLLSGWMSQAPAIDGEFAVEEWTEAAAIDLGSGVTARLGNDGRTLYLMLLDARPSEPVGDRMILFFDDDGGASPFLDDGTWTSPDCQNDPALGEGEIWFEVTGAVDFYEWRTTGGGAAFCPPQALAGRQHSAIGLNPGLGVIYEAAIPLDGLAPLRGAQGQRFGLQLRAVDGSGLGEVCFPSCSLAPGDFRNLVLATPRCNVGVEDFDSGLAAVGLPLEWTTAVTSGSGQGWVKSAIFGDPDLCGANGTAGSGSAACVANGFYGAAASTATLRMPMTVVGQSQVYAYFLFTFEIGAPNDTLAFGFEFADGSTTTTFTYSFSWPPPGGATGTVVPLPAGNLPVAMIFTHHTATGGGIEFGYANIDNVRLVCNPLLFTDDFESGMSTHWSATTP